jgi:hypothetical protein
MSPGSVTEKLHFFVAEYDAESEVVEGYASDRFSVARAGL